MNRAITSPVARLISIAVAFAAMAGLAHAQSGKQFSPPEGCEAFLTVQQKSCTVSHHWTCEADAPGAQWYAEGDEMGPYYIGQTDAETQWLQSFNLAQGRTTTLQQPAPDPANLTALLETGVDTYDFRLTSPEGDSRVFGYDSIVDEVLSIDGEPLARTEFHVTETDAEGEVTYEAKGHEYVSLRHRRFFAGTGQVLQGAGGAFEYDSSPVDFIYPGEPGFLASAPLYGCFEQKAAAQLMQKDVAQ